uniref:Transmembrane protein 19 n=1 Tax=Romanomermis culicivorax TaxID=13658 RepID=A0A915JKF6_ROMCU
SSRNWLQVVSNGGPALAFSLLYVLKFGAGTGLFVVDMRKNFHQSLFDLMSLGCLAGAAGDTWASEIGAVFGSPFPRLLTTFKCVPAGGLTIGAAYVIFVFFFALSYDPKSLYTVIMMCTACGLLSSGIDSLLGATIQFSGGCKMEKNLEIVFCKMKIFRLYVVMRNGYL